MTSSRVVAVQCGLNSQSFSLETFKPRDKIIIKKRNETFRTDFSFSHCTYYIARGIFYEKQLLHAKNPIYQSKMASKIEVLDSDLLDLPPSCIEFWPNNPSWFVIGTYELDKEDEDSWVNVEKASSEVVVNTDPFPNKEGIISSAPLSLVDYSHEPLVLVEDSDVILEESKDQSDPPSTLQKRNGSVMLYHLEDGSL